MGSSNSNSVSSNSGQWKNRLYFYPQSHKFNASQYYFTDHDLIFKQHQFVDLQEAIQTISIYKTPLSQKQWTNWLFNHQYVCFKTEKWWWSIQKNDQGLTMQRSKNKEYVRDHYRNSLRCTAENWKPQLVQENVGRYNLKRLFKWLEQKKLLKNGYNWLSNNCKHFANLLFNQFAKTKKNQL